MEAFISAEFPQMEVMMLFDCLSVAAWNCLDSFGHSEQAARNARHEQLKDKFLKLARVVGAKPDIAWSQFLDLKDSLLHTYKHYGDNREAWKRTLARFTEDARRAKQHPMQELRGT
jgi:hypothetical protein